MVAALMSIGLNIATRLVDGWMIPGLDGYAGYSIAAALFLALPAALRHGDHIQVTLVVQHAGPRVKAMLEYWALGAGTLLAAYLAWFSCRLVWLSYTFHDVAPTGDASPLWIPQLSMALGSVGFLVAFVDALVARIQGVKFFADPSDMTSSTE